MIIKKEINMFIFGLIIGSVIGGIVGFFVAALCQISNRGENKKHEDD